MNSDTPPKPDFEQPGPNSDDYGKPKSNLNGPVSKGLVEMIVVVIIIAVTRLIKRVLAKLKSVREQ